jgi:NAD(P)-dependent dehydrogenase (short-subunit alcohol dehydrogenase family)
LNKGDKFMGVRELMDLKGRVALITGGSRGLGLQIAEALGEMGARVVITARKVNELEAAAGHLSNMGIECLPLVNDLADTSAILPLVENILSTWGAIDILVNNAGATWGAPAVDHPLEAWQKVIHLNLTGTFVITQAVGKLHMIPQRKGKIINIASVSGLQGKDPRIMSTIAYHTSKGGMVNMTRALAAEWAQYQITVNAIAPGFFPTKMTRGTLDKTLDFFLDRCPLGRVGGDEDLKGAAVLLASDASAYITGQILVVDGGQTII